MKLRTAALLLILPAALRAQQAVLWVPSETYPPGPVLELLAADKDLRLTAALTALPKGAEDLTLRLQKEGRLELALRVPGDPPLQLLYAPAAEGTTWTGKPSTATLSNDPYFLSLRLGLARDAAMKNFKKAPTGLAATPGGFTPDFLPLARAFGLKWLACGPSTGAPAALHDGLWSAHFVRQSVSSPTAAAFMVFDETLEADPAALRAAMTAFLNERGERRLLTVSEALAAASTAQAQADTLPWSMDYTPWAAAPQQAGALAALARTRADLMLHLNSLQGEYKPAAPAFEEYFSAESSAGLLALASQDAESSRNAEVELLTSLVNAYRLMQRSPPAWALSGLADPAGAAAGAQELRVSASPDGFEITNADRKPKVPDSPALATAAPEKVWKLLSFKTVAAQDEIVFSFSPGAIENPGRLPSGFGTIRLDLYMDVNHRPRAGVSRPLEGRPLRFFPDNAWEYALEITPEKAVLYAVTPKGPQQTGVYRPKAEDGTLTVKVPRAALKGNPLLWGYAALLLASPDGKAFSITDYIAEEIANGYIYAVRPGKK